MSRKVVSLPVIYSRDAIIELQEIADWNEKTYSRIHAASYIAFLEKHIDGLSNNYPQGRPLDTRPDLRYIQIRRRAKGHGHIAVYSVQGNNVVVAHIFHTAQDWKNNLR